MAEGDAFDANSLEHIQHSVRRFYDQRKAGDDSEWTRWLCPTDVPASRLVRQAMAQSCDGEHRSRSCGCGRPFPDLLAGSKVLDIGCGSGADCACLSHLVGRDGHVVGLDLCPTLVSYARTHADEAGLSNVEFVCCDAEDMSNEETVMSNAPYDVIVANCSLCQVRGGARSSVLKQVHSLLKPGGELYVCDLFVSVDVGDCVRRSSKAWVEGVAGAWMWSSFQSAAEEADFSKPLLVASRRLDMSDERRRDLAADMGVFGRAVDMLHELEDASGFQVCAASYRLFRSLPVDDAVSEVADSPLNAARIVFNPSAAHLDTHVQLTRKIVCHSSRPVVVAKEIAAIVQRSRLASSFAVSPAQSVIHVQSECIEPFLPKSTTTAGLSTPLSMPLNGLTLLTAAPAISCSMRTISVPPNLGNVLNTTPGLKELRDLVVQSKNGGCGPRGC